MALRATAGRPYKKSKCQQITQHHLIIIIHINYLKINVLPLFSAIDN